MNAQLAHLIEQVDQLMETLEGHAARHQDKIDRVHESHREGATNLLHYAQLRTRDFRSLQAGLASIGATRLSTTEPAVLARLKSARNVLSAYAGEDLKYTGEDVVNAFAKADDLLEARAERLLGPLQEQEHSRIIVTLPSESADDPQLIHDFVEAGMDLARINCAHDDAEIWLRMIEHVKAAARDAGREIKIAMDLAGPKVRTGEIQQGPAVARARVTRDQAGQVLQTSKLWITAEGADIDVPPEIEELPGRPALPIQVEAPWLHKLEGGQHISLYDNRNRKRSFTITRVYSESDSRGPTEKVAVLAEGLQNAYISNHTMIRRDFDRTRVFGILPTEQKLRLHIGDRLVLTDAEVVCDPTPADGSIPRISCTLPEAIAAIEPGHPVLFDDGAIAARVVEKHKGMDGYTDVTLEVVRAKPNGTNLAAHKGINLPDTDLPLPSLTEEDIAALEFVATHGDVANVSFIRNADDVAYLLEQLEQIALRSDDAEKVRNLGLVLKIETIPAYMGLPGVLLEGMRHPNLGVMIARGDLAVELGFDRMAEVPLLISQMCESAHVPVILATQVLENMAKTGLPSRAEITDAAEALRNEAVMLNKGPHITDCIRVLDQLSRKLGNSQRKNRQLLRKIVSWSVGSQV